MADAHLYTRKTVVKMLCQMLGRIDTAMLTACTAKGKHERREATVDIALHMSIGELVNGIEESEYLAVILKEFHHGLV